MLREQTPRLRSLLIGFDVALCGAIFGAVLLSRQAGFPAGVVDTIVPEITAGWRWFCLGIFAALTLPVSLRSLELDPSIRLESFSSTLKTLLVAAGITSAVMSTVAFFVAVPIRPSELASCVAFQLAAVGLLRLSIFEGLRAIRRRGRNLHHVLVIGTGPRAKALTDTLNRHPEWGLRIIGYVDETDIPCDPEIPRDCVHKFSDMPILLRDQVIDEVITACPRAMLATLGPLVSVSSAAGIPVTVMTDLFGEYVPPPRIRRFASHTALCFAPVHHNRSKLWVKRALDIIGALVGLVFTAPIIATAALSVRLTSRGPILFKQIRCGLNGRPFVMLKLRTMVEDAEARRDEVQHLNEMAGPVFKIESDPRITPVGKILRGFSIDELPQFWNVLVGDMSLVGPRPPIPSEVVQYAMSERRRLSMRPGLTCLWQVSGRNEIGFDEWVEMDLEYIDGWSLSQDFRILAKTVPTVVNGGGS